VPIVPAAILFDLGVGANAKIRPTADCGYTAAEAATTAPVAEGSIGAGAGATVGKFGGAGRSTKSGLGTAAITLPNGLVVAAIVLLMAVACIFSAIRQLMKHKEHPSPYKPTDAIVAEGVYGFTRNPIYIGFLLIVIAMAVAANTVWLLVAAAVLFLALQFGVVRAEEKYLSAKFGDAYANYCRHVRRWI